MSSKIRHGGSPLNASHQKCILISETECHVINNLLTELAQALLGNIGPRCCADGRYLTMTSGEYSLVRPSRSISEWLLLTDSTLVLWFFLSDNYLRTVKIKS